MGCAQPYLGAYGPGPRYLPNCDLSAGVLCPDFGAHKKTLLLFV